jgi:peptidylprolyl isomerase
VLLVRTRKVLAALMLPAMLALSSCGDEVEGDGDTQSSTSDESIDQGAEEAAAGGEPAVEGELEGVEVSGAVDEKPTVDLDAPPFQIDETTAQVIEEGEGDAVVEDNTSVQAGFTVVNGRTGEELESSYTSGQPATFAVSEQSGLIPGLYRGLLGQQEGGRVAVAVPPADAFGETGNPQIGVEPTDTLIFGRA